MRFFYKIKTLIALTGIICMANSCTKDFKELNISPSLVTEALVKPDNLFSMVQQGSIFILPDLGRVGNSLGRTSEFVGFQSSQSSGLPFKNQDFDFYFNNYYRIYLININETIRLTQDDPVLSNKNAMARIFRVWLWQNLTDMYGDIPYTEAALGKANLIAEPKYDKQEDIYKDLFTQLKAATEQLSDDPSKFSYGAADLLFKGDVNSWRKFGNSLRLRMAIRVRYVDPALAQQNISDVINAPLISANAENATVLSEVIGPTTLNANKSPLLILLANNLQEPRHLGFPLLEILAKNNDPRMPIYFRLPNKIDPSSSIPYRARPINVFDFETPR